MLKAIQLKDYWIVVKYENTKDHELFHDNGKIMAYCGMNCPTSVYKLIAQSKPVHEGIPLFDVPSEWEEDVERLAEEYIKDEWANDDESVKFGIDVGFKQGYQKHAEKYKWTDEDLRNAFKCGQQWVHDITHTNKEPENFNQFLQSLNKPKEYEVELEMKQDKLYIKPEDLIKYQSQPKELQLPYTTNPNDIFKPKIVNGKVIIKSYKQI